MTQQQETNRGPAGRGSIRWIGLGTGLTIVGLIVAGIMLANYLTEVPGGNLQASGPTIIQLTAPPAPTAEQTSAPSAPTVAPTATTAPTPDLSIAPAEVTAGYYAIVVETGGVGVTVRNGPSTSNIPVVVSGEGSVLFVIEGPTPGGDYQWWLVRLPDGTEGWVAGDFLAPSAAP